MRYAIYFAPPPDSPLARFGDAWLGRDAASGAALVAPTLPGLAAARQAAITRAPRGYGFHATLKPPFRLRDGEAEDALVRALAAFAAGQPAFAAPPLALASIDGFLALVLGGPSPAMQALADAAVAELDRFRAPPEAAELARRRQAGLSPRQDALLDRWGYPYVMEEFRFHMTLTDRLAEPEHGLVRAGLTGLVAPLCREPLQVADICLFVQRDGDFRLERRFALQG